MVTAVLVAAFALSGAVSGVLAAVQRWGRLRSPLSGVNAFMAAGVAVMSLLSLVHLLVPRPSVVWPVASAEHLVSATVVAGVFCLCMTVADRSWRLSRRTALLLAVQPAAELVLAVSNPRHHLLYTGLAPGAEGVPALVPGPLFWACAAYVYLLLAVSAALVVRAWRLAPRGQRELYRWTMVAFAPPIAANVVGLSMPVRTMELTALGLGVTVLIAYGLLVRSLPQRQIQVPHRQVFNAITDAVVVIDRDQRILDFNPAAEAKMRRIMPGLPEDVFGQAFQYGIELDLREDAATEQSVTDLLGLGIEVQIRISPLRDGHGECVGWALVARNVTEINRRRREAEESARRLREQLDTIEALRADLAEQAVRDALTGLYNRRHLAEVLEREAARSAAEGTPLSLMIIDVDHFKRINDTCGHGGGDTVLVHLARLLTGSVRQGDTVARYGGEEFVLLMPGATEESAWRRAEELREQSGRSVIDVAGRPLAVTFSAGVAELVPGGTTEDLLRMADAALYEAKRLGRDRVERAMATPAERPVTGPSAGPAAGAAA
ncbi:diguanylate cyclase [Planomonospora corallina]|uniref:Diguanylate cyclase n=1 Tax=Planomonospora corallina TaxID=1806052 RepID=A0ABV8I9C0_9ACTN